MAPPKQDLGNHARYLPLYHVVLGALLLVNMVYALRKTWILGTIDSKFQALVALALLLMFWFVRAFPLSAQDRVIRLELRLRLRELAPDVMPRFDDLTVAQVTALRFAGDAELPELARRVLAGELTRGGDIKRAITDWQGDHWRM